MKAKIFSKQNAFLSAVVFSIYLMLTLPLSTAQSFATVIQVNFFAPDGSTRLQPPTPVSLGAPSSLVNKQIKVEDKSPVQGQWEPEFTSIGIKINSQPSVLINDVYIIPCIDEKFKLQDPTDCIRSVQANKKSAIKFSTFVDYQANWLDISNAKDVGTLNFGQQEARLLTFATLEIAGKRQWFGYWDVIKRHGIGNSQSDWEILQDNELDSVDVVLSDSKLLNLTADFIKNKNVIPKGWVSRVIPNKINQDPNSQIASLHISGIDQADTPEKFDVRKTDREGFVDTEKILKEYGLVFPSTVNLIGNPFTIAPKPKLDCGNGVPDLDAGETRENCCRDFSDGCGEPNLVCSFDANNKNDPGLCIDKTKTGIVGRFEETEFTSCERRHPTKLTYELISVPTGTQVDEVWVELDRDTESLATRSDVITTCDKGAKPDRDACFANGALSLQDHTLCDRISDAKIKDSCFQQVALLTQETKTCSKIRSDEKSREACRKAVEDAKLKRPKERKPFGHKIIPLTGCKPAPGGRTECEFKLEKFKDCRQGDFTIRNNVLFAKARLSNQKSVELKSTLQDISVSQTVKSLNEIIKTSEKEIRDIFSDLKAGVGDAKDILKECVEIVKTSVTYAKIMATMSLIVGGLAIVGLVKDFVPDIVSSVAGGVKSWYEWTQNDENLPGSAGNFDENNPPPPGTKVTVDEGIFESGGPATLIDKVGTNSKAGENTFRVLRNGQIKTVKGSDIEGIQAIPPPALYPGGTIFSATGYAGSIDGKSISFVKTGTTYDGLLEGHILSVDGEQNQYADDLVRIDPNKANLRATKLPQSAFHPQVISGLTPGTVTGIGDPKNPEARGNPITIINNAANQANDKGQNTAFTAIGAFLQGIGQLTTAGLAVCKVAETMMSIHTQMAKALTEIQSFMLCMDINIHNIGDGLCNGADPENPQQAGQAALNCVAQFTSCNNQYLGAASNTLQGLNNYVDQRTTDFQNYANQYRKIGFSMTAKNTQTGQNFERTNEACGQDQVIFELENGNNFVCGGNWDIKYRKQASGVTDALRTAVNNIDVRATNLETSYAVELRRIDRELEKPDYLGDKNALQNQKKKTLEGIESLAFEIQSQASRLADPNDKTITASAAVKNAAAQIEVEAKSIKDEIGKDTLTDIKLTQHTNIIKSKTSLILTGIKDATAEPRSLKQLLGLTAGPSSPQNAPAIFNIGDPADGEYVFEYDCPKLTQRESLTVTYRQDCSQLPGRNIAANIGQPLEGCPEEGKLWLVPSKELGVAIHGIRVDSTKSELTRTCEYRVNQKEAIVMLSNKKIQGEAVELENCLVEYGKKADYVGGAFSTGKSKRIVLKPDDAEAKIPDLDQGTYVVKYTCIPKSGDPEKRKIELDVDFGYSKADVSRSDTTKIGKSVFRNLKSATKIADLSPGDVMYFADTTKHPNAATIKNREQLKEGVLIAFSETGARPLAIENKNLKLSDPSISDIIDSIIIEEAVHPNTKTVGEFIGKKTGTVKFKQDSLSRGKFDSGVYSSLPFRVVSIQKEKGPDGKPTDNLIIKFKNDATNYEFELIREKTAQLIKDNINDLNSKSSSNTFAELQNNMIITFFPGHVKAAGNEKLRQNSDLTIKQATPIKDMLRLHFTDQSFEDFKNEATLEDEKIKEVKREIKVPHITVFDENFDGTKLSFKVKVENGEEHAEALLAIDNTDAKQKAIINNGRAELLVERESVTAGTSYKIKVKLEMGGIQGDVESNEVTVIAVPKSKPK